MNFEIIFAAGVASGTILLFAAIGEIFTERAGIINLGVEGMMFVGALAGFKIGVDTGNPWLGLALAMAAGAALSLLHAIVCIHFQADQIVSGLALTFVGTGIALVLGEGLADGPDRRPPADPDHPAAVRRSRSSGPVFFTDQSILVYLGYLLVPVAYVWIDHTRPGMHLRAVGEQPSAADALGVDVYRTRYAVHPGRRCAGGSGGRDHQHGRDPRLVRGHRRRPGSAGSRSASSSSPSGARVGRSSAPTSSRSSGA